MARRDGDTRWAGDEGQAFADDLEQRSAYREGILDDVTVPPTDPVREAKDRDLDDPADVPIPPEVLRDGGPSRSGGGLTTTGGSAGPASVRRVKDGSRGGQRSGRKVAPTTTGDATSGGMGTPAGGSTSDATTRE